MEETEKTYFNDGQEFEVTSKDAMLDRGTIFRIVIGNPSFGQRVCFEAMRNGKLCRYVGVYEPGRPFDDPDYIRVNGKFRVVITEGGPIKILGIVEKVMSPLPKKRKARLYLVKPKQSSGSSAPAAVAYAC
jgi:hypothetical protein